MSNVATVLGVVPMLGPPLAGALLEHLSWRWIFGLLALLTLAIGMIVWQRLAETLRAPDPAATDPRRIAANCLEMLRNPKSFSFVLTTYLIYGGVYVFLALIPFIALDTFGLSAGKAGLLVGASAFAIWSGAVINNRLIRRVPVRTMLRASTGLALAAGLAVLAAVQGATHGWFAPPGAPAGLAVIVAAVMVFCASFGMTQSNCIVLSLQPLPHIAGTASALGASVQTLCGALGAWIASQLYDGTPAALGWCMLAAGALSFLVFTFVAARHTPATLARA
jgi:DHA1 family bicyclomycin/chloramphenicol resistance-like MFS transporter